MKGNTVTLWIAGIGILAITAGVGILQFTDLLPEPAQERKEENAVAVVNGEAISRSEFESTVAQFETRDPSQPVDQEGVLDQMIDQLLLYQDATNKGMSASDEEVQVELDQVVARFESREQFEEALQESNLSEGELKGDLERQLVFEQYVEYVKQDREIAVSEEEIASYYEDSIVGQENVPELEEVQEQIEQQIEQQKLQQEFEQVLANLRSAADITRLL